MSSSKGNVLVDAGFYDKKLANGFSLLVDTKPRMFTEGKLRVGDYAVEVMHTPEHTSGSSCFYHKDENVLFTGDTFMLPFNGSPDHPTGNEKERQEIIKKFKARTFQDDMKIYPGHRGNTTYKERMENNVDLQ